MANDKIYPIDMGTKDILLQNEGGGGMIMNDQFIGIVGNMLPDQKELLDGQDNVNGTNIQTDKFSSNIIITNASSNPVGMSDLASKNFDSLDQSIGADQVVAPTVNNNCGGEAFLNYEFQELAKNYEAFKELWQPRNDSTKKAVELTTKPKKGLIDPKYQNEKVKTEQQLKDLLIDQPIIDIIKSKITLNGSNFFNIFDYDKNNYNLSSEIKFQYTDRWIRDENKDDKYSLGKVKDKNKLFKNNNTNQTEVRSIFDIQTLPSGLRSLIFIFTKISTYSNDLPAVLLVAIGPEELNILTGLGITKAQAFNDNPIDVNKTAKKKALSDNEIYKKFFDQYDDIINAYNTDKSKFLNTVYKIVKEYFEKEAAYYIKIGEESQWYNDNIDKDYGLTLLDIGLSIALKYADCPDEYEVIGNIPTAPSPSPSVTVTAAVAPPPTKSEEEEGIYNAEFLPASDDPGADLFDSGYGDTCYAAVEKAKNDISNKKFDSKDLVVFGGGLPPDFSNIDIVKELDTYIKFSSQAREDYDNGIINPNTILDLLRIGKGAKIKIYVGTARKGHSCETTSGNLSRHMKGFGLDLAGFYDLTGAIAASNKMITSSASSASGVPADFKTIADNFVSTAMQLSGAGRGEGGIQRGILWYFNEKKKGGNHFNHVHYSNSDPYTGWNIKTIPSSFKCDCSKVKASKLTAENCK
jgi:hypothetical protein